MREVEIKRAGAFIKIIHSWGQITTVKASKLRDYWKQSSYQTK